MKKVKHFLKENNIEIQFLDLDVNGYYDSSNKLMFINTSLDEFNAKKTIYHELGHGVLHDEFTPLYKNANYKLKMEYEADCFMIGMLLKEYLGSDYFSIEQFNYVEFMSYYGIRYEYEDYIKNIIVKCVNTCNLLNAV